ncbi:regulator of MON1-CCZ1 complex isoform X2 [Drosophila pseudoobscura]|uniref:Regulator of MON1-CCZ1 complex isoform X2 n=1 Tax=Drosophila pseudoobscura pseudoobscura TaxID=46245 RepID=A0A6I8VJ68_DROPS|nr:regulator of MON1-CCZ1 complex isoform X2 [Drosophila pseudoobscura]
MDNANGIHYIELSRNPIRFDAVSQLTNVFFDDSNKQIFAVRSGGATGVVVKGPVPNEDTVISFCMNDRGGAIRSIKFSPDNQILAVQRKENAVEFVCFQGEQPMLQDIITHQVKTMIHGFVWIHNREVALISNTGVEVYTVLPEKRQVRSVKSLSISIKWFAWCCDANVALLCTTEGNSLVPVLVKQKVITKLPKVDSSPSREVQESKVTLGQVYGVLAVLILQSNSSSGMMEVEVHLLNGPGLAPRKCHVLRLSLVGRFAINTVDNLIVVHHQATGTSLLFDISLTGEVIQDITYHAPITTGRSIKPFGLKLPSLSPDGQILQCELYSTHWVLFQPNIVIDAKLGCMWYLNLCIDPICNLISDRIRLTEFLLQRSSGKQVLLKVLGQLVDDQYKGTLLPVLETIFSRINKIYASWVQLELQNQTAQPSNVKTSTVKHTSPPIVLIEQLDMVQIFQRIARRPHTETILMLYLQSLNKFNIAAQEELSKMIISELIHNHSFDTLRRLVSYSMVLESKAVACFLLSHSDVDTAISQVAIDMLGKIQAHEIIIEVMLGQGKVIDALRLAKNSLGLDKVPARKFLEAAHKTNDDLIFHSVFRFFQMRNLKLYETLAFPKAEQCTEFIQHYNSTFPVDNSLKPQIS